MQVKRIPVHEAMPEAIPAIVEDEDCSNSEDIDRALASIAKLIPPKIMAQMIKQSQAEFGRNYEANCMAITNGAMAYIELLSAALNYVSPSANNEDEDFKTTIQN